MGCIDMETPPQKDILVEEDARQYKARLRDVLDVDLRDSLPTVALIFGVLFAFFAVSHAFVLPRDIAPVMITLAAVTSLLNFGLLWALRRWVLPFRWAHPVAAADTCVALLNILLHLYLTADPLQTTNVTLLLIGVGFVVFSTAWWGLIVGLTILGWIAVVLLIGPDPAWTHFAFALVSALAVSLLVHVIHRRTYVRIERLRVQDRQQRAKLEQTLRTTERIQRALQTTIDVAQNITAVFDLETLLNHVCALIKEDYDYYHVGIFLLDDAGEFVVARAGTGAIGRALCDKGHRLAVGKEGVVGWVAAHRQVANVSNIAEDPRYLALPETTLPETAVGEAATIFSELALPLEVAGQLLGVLNIEHDTPGAFDAEDVQVLEALADQVAVAIQNASNYHAEQTRRQITERLYTVGMALSRSLDLTEILGRTEARVFTEAVGSGGAIKALTLKGGGGLSRKDLDELTQFVGVYGAKGLAWFKKSPEGWQSPLAKFIGEEIREEISRKASFEGGDLLLVVAGAPSMVNESLGHLRVNLGERFGLIPDGRFDFVWVVDFPLL